MRVVTRGRRDIRGGGGRLGMRMADVLGAATRRVQDVTDHERSVRWLRGCCCLWGFGAGGTSHDGLRESW